jgi:hypothetical protein
MQNFRVLGLALIAVVALSALAVSAAQATTSLHSEEEKTRIEGTQVTQNKWIFDGGNFVCTSAVYHGTTTAKTVTTITLTPTYSGCSFAGRAATMDTNGCDLFLFIVGSSFPVTATMDIVCPFGKELTVTVPSIECTIHIEPGQNGLSHITFANGGAGTTRDALATLAVKGITYTETKPCPGSNGSTTNNGQLTGTVTFKGFKDEAGGAQVGIWAE